MPIFTSMRSNPYGYSEWSISFTGYHGPTKVAELCIHTSPDLLLQSKALLSNKWLPIFVKFHLLILEYLYHVVLLN